MMEGSQTSYSRFNCAQKQCTTKVGHNISLFSFPKDPECAKLWALYCDRPEMLSLTPEELNRNFKLCEKHFSAEDVESGGLRKRIQRGALPIKPHDGKRRSSRQKGKEMAAEGKGGKEMAARGKGGKEKAAGDERDPLDINSTDFASLFGNNVEFVIEEESDTITISKATESDKQGAAEVTLNPIKSNPTKSSSSSSKPKDFNSSFMSFVDKKVNKEKNQPGLTPQYNKITEPVAVKSPATPMRKLNDNPAPKRKLDEDQAPKVSPMLAIPPPRQEQQVMVPAPAQLFLVNPGPIPLAIQLDPSGVGYLSAFPMQAMPPLIVPTVPVALNNPQQVQVPVVPKKDAVKRSEPRALDKVNILRKKPRVEPPPPPEKPKNSSMILTSPISTKYTNIQKLLADTKLHLSKATNRCASAEKAEYIMVVDNEADNNKEKVEKPEKVTVINDKRISVIESSEKTPSESLNSSGGTQEAEEPKKKVAVPAKVNGGVNSAPSQVNSGSGLCYVPNCSLKKGEKVFLFKVPYDQQLIDIWQKCIGRKDRPLEKSDTVCEKHFSKDDIQVLVQHHDRNLMAFPRLKKLAIPCVEYFKGCCVPRCGKTNGRMYKFPVTTPHAVQLWLYMLKASDLLKLPIEELVRYRVCERHFERTSFDEKGELLHSAAPMQHVPVTDTKFLEQDVVEISKDDSKKSSLKCIFRECRLNKPQDQDLQIFLFPSDFDRCKQWLRICKRIDLLRSTSGRTLMNLSRFGFGMCSRHFVESDFVEGDKSQLRMEAVPKPDPANDVVVVLDSHSSPDPTLNCAVFFCEENSKPSPGSSRPGQQQFPFPDPINDKERYHIWLKLVGNPELVGMPPEFVRSKYGVCRKHFESHFYNRTAGQEQLVSVAVPTKNLIGPRKWLFGTKFYQTKIKEYINKCINADSSSKGNIKWMLSEFLDANQPQSVCTLNENQIKFPALGHHLEFKDVKKEKAPFEVFNCTKKNFTLVKDIGRGEMVNIHSAVIIADDNRVQKEVMQNLIDELVKADENKKVTNFKVNIPV